MKNNWLKSEGQVRKSAKASVCDLTSTLNPSASLNAAAAVRVETSRKSYLWAATLIKIYHSQSAKGTTSQPIVWKRNHKNWQTHSSAAWCISFYVWHPRSFQDLQAPKYGDFWKRFWPSVLVLASKLHGWDFCFLPRSYQPQHALIICCVCFGTTLSLPPRLRSEQRNLPFLHKSVLIFNRADCSRRFPAATNLQRYIRASVWFLKTLVLKHADWSRDTWTAASDLVPYILNCHCKKHKPCS